MGVPQIYCTSAVERARKYIHLEIQCGANKNIGKYVGKARQKYLYKYPRTDVQQKYLYKYLRTAKCGEGRAHKYTARPLMWVAHTDCQDSIFTLNDIEIH